MTERHTALVLAISTLTIIGFLTAPVAGLDITDTDDIGGEQLTEPQDAVDTDGGDLGSGDGAEALGAGGGDDGGGSDSGDSDGGDDESDGSSGDSDDCGCDDDDDSAGDQDGSKDKDGDDGDNGDGDNGDGDNGDGDNGDGDDGDGDDGDNGDGDDGGDGHQSNSQVNEEDDPVDPNLLGGNSVTIAVGGQEQTIESPTIDGNQENDDSDWDGSESGDTTQQSQQSNSDDDVADLDALSGNSIVVGIGAEDTAGGDGGDTDSQSNDNAQYDDRDGDTTQQSQQSNSDDDVADAALLNGNSLGVTLASQNTSAGDGGDTGTQSNDNNQGSDCDGSDTTQQSQQSNSDDDVADAALLNGNSGVLDIAGQGTTSGDGGDTNTQSNDNWQTSGGCSGDTAQQGQQSNSDADVVSAVLLNGNSLAGSLGGENTSAGDGGDTGTQFNENGQKGGEGDTAAQHQGGSDDGTLVPIEGINDLSFAGGLGDSGTTAGEGGTTESQENDNDQFTDDDH